MPTRNVVLTERQSALIDRLVVEGVYQNASEVLRAGLTLLERDRAAFEAKLDALRAAIQLGIDDVEAGRVVTFESASDAIEHLRSRRAALVKDVDTDEAAQV
jgi:antitoxin ParD1/3/4